MPTANRALLKSHPPTKALRDMACGLARKHLRGDARAEAIAFIMDRHRSKMDISAFINRMVDGYESRDPCGS